MRGYKTLGQILKIKEIKESKRIIGIKSLTDESNCWLYVLKEENCGLENKPEEIIQMQHRKTKKWKMLREMDDKESKLCLNRVPEEVNKRGGGIWGDNDW